MNTDLIPHHHTHAPEEQRVCRWKRGDTMWERWERCAWIFKWPLSKHLHVVKKEEICPKMLNIMYRVINSRLLNKQCVKWMNEWMNGVNFHSCVAWLEHDSHFIMNCAALLPLPVKSLDTHALPLDIPPHTHTHFCIIIKSSTLWSNTNGTREIMLW